MLCGSAWSQRGYQLLTDRAPARSQNAVCAPQAKRLQKQLNIPNGYFLTKRMAELYMLRESAHLPVAIVRPSLVGCVGGLPQPGCADRRMLTWCRAWLPGSTSSSTCKHALAVHCSLPGCQNDSNMPRTPARAAEEQAWLTCA